MHNKDIFGNIVDTGDLVIAPLQSPKSGLAIAMVCKITAATILVQPIDRLENNTYRVKEFVKVLLLPSGLDTLTWEQQLGSELYKTWMEERKDLGLDAERKE